MLFRIIVFSLTFVSPLPLMGAESSLPEIIKPIIVDLFNRHQQGEEDPIYDGKTASEIIETYSEGSLDVQIPETVDLDKLPMTGWTEEELYHASESGNVEAMIHMAYRLIINEQHNTVESNSGLWNTYRHAKKWLGLAMEKRRPGAEFLYHIHELSGGYPKEIDKLPGYEEFVKGLESGDTLLFMVTTVLRCEELDVLLRKCVEVLYENANEGDEELQKRYVHWALLSFPAIEYEHLYKSIRNMTRGSYSGSGKHLNYNVFLTSKAVKWVYDYEDAIGDETKEGWLALFGQYNGETMPEDLDRIFYYWIPLCEKGYLQCIPNFGTSIYNYWEFIKRNYPDTDWSPLREQYRKLMRKRGSVETVKEVLSRWNHKNDQDEKFKDFEEAVRKLYKIGHTGAVFNPKQTMEYKGERRVHNASYLALLEEYASQEDVDALEALAWYYDETDWEKAMTYRKKALKIVEEIEQNGFKLLAKKRVTLKLATFEMLLDHEKDETAKKQAFAEASALLPELKTVAPNRFGECCAIIGRMYELGFGVEPDLETAAQHYSRGASDFINNEDCINYLKQLYEENSDEEPSE